MYLSQSGLTWWRMQDIEFKYIQHSNDMVSIGKWHWIQFKHMKSILCINRFKCATFSHTFLCRRFQPQWQQHKQVMSHCPQWLSPALKFKRRNIVGTQQFVICPQRPQESMFGLNISLATAKPNMQNIVIYFNKLTYFEKHICDILYCHPHRKETQF